MLARQTSLTFLSPFITTQRILLPLFFWIIIINSAISAAKVDRFYGFVLIFLTEINTIITESHHFYHFLLPLLPIF